MAAPDYSINGLTAPPVIGATTYTTVGTISADAAQQLVEVQNLSTSTIVLQLDNGNSANATFLTLKAASTVYGGDGGYYSSPWNRDRIVIWGPSGSVQIAARRR